MCKVVSALLFVVDIVYRSRNTKSRDARSTDYLKSLLKTLSSSVYRGRIHCLFHIERPIGGVTYKVAKQGHSLGH